MYLLDVTGYRPGRYDVKDANSGGVGIRTLHKQHIELLGEHEKIVFFNLSGKRNVPYRKRHAVTERAFELLETFRQNTPNNKVFYEVSYKDLTSYLERYSVTARVFRTYKGSSTFERVLNDRTENWIERNPRVDRETKETKLKQIYEEARTYVQDQLNHLSKESGDSYIDPRIAFAW